MIRGEQERRAARRIEFKYGIDIGNAKQQGFAGSGKNHLSLPLEAARRTRNEQRSLWSIPPGITMIATMPPLTIHHKTEYRDAPPVASGD
jgi:hypothetical protein